jgi:ABC-type spermidine/putrescine transport system permease subunit I
MTSGGASYVVPETTANSRAKVGGFWQGWMAVVPSLALALICAIPLFVAIYESLVIWDGLQRSGWGTLHGYQVALAPQRLAVLQELLVRGVLVATIDLAIAIPLADFIVRRKSAAWRWSILMILNVPFLVSSVSRAFGWFHILNRDGFINKSWTFLVPQAEPISWLIFSRTAVIITLVCATLAFAVFPIVLALKDNRDSLWSACDDIGVGTIRRLWGIVLPLCAPGALASWFCVFWLAFGASVEASVVDGPTEMSLGRTISELLNANEFSAVYALSSLIVFAFCAVGILIAVMEAAALRPPRFMRRFHAAQITPVVALVRANKPGLRSSAISQRLGSFFAPAATGILLLVFVLAPVWSILALSVSPMNSIVGPGGPQLDFRWYIAAFQGDTVREAWTNSLWVAIPVGIASALIAFCFGLTWWSPLWRRITIGGLIVLALLPPDTHALGVLQIYKSFGFQESSLVLVGISQFAWALPFASAVMFAINSTVDPSLFSAGLELGATRLRLVRSVLFGMTWPGFVSAFIIGFLLSLNDYTRASYLSGSNQMLSQYIYGQMRSGTNPSVYAVGGINVVAAMVLFGVVAILLRFSAKLNTRPSTLS